MGGASSIPAAGSTRHDKQANTESNSPSAAIESGNAVGQESERRRSLTEHGRGGKRIKSVDINGVSSPTKLCDVHQLQYSGECSIHEQETECLFSSCHPTESTCGNLLEHSGGGHNMKHASSFKLDGAKHKVFLCHSGTQKDFVEQLCADLEAQGCIFPFFDQRHHSLPKGKDFVPFIKEAAQLCHVAVIVLSAEFLCSKWPMIELAEFHAAQQAGNQRLNMLPLFYKLSADDLNDRAIEECWMPTWVQLASKDKEKRIDVAKWSAAMRALRKVNGLTLDRNAMSEVGYRKEVVRTIFQLSPPDLLYGSSRDMVGYDRMCEIATSRFVKNATVGAPVLGLYGTTGRGKSTLSKALCDYFSAEFSSRVCHVELLSERSRMRRQRLMLKNLCGIERDVLDRITDDRQGLKLLRDCVQREPVFLAIDNVTSDESSWREAQEYLMIGFHPQSRILLTSRSKANIQDLLPGVEFCMPMPRLTVKEAGEIFLRSAAPMKSIFGLTDEERRVVGLCIQQCLFESEGYEVSCEPDVHEKQFLSDRHMCESGWRSYHPLALSALGDFFRRYISNTQMLRWKDHLEKHEDLLKDVWKSRSIRSIIELQFSSLHPSEQLLFLDIALYMKEWVNLNYSIDYHNTSHLFRFFEWLSKLHDVSVPVLKRKLQDLTRSGMIMYDNTDHDWYGLFSVPVPSLYKEFAEWYATEHGMKGLKNSWGVFQSSRAAQKCHSPKSDLVRLRVFDLSRTSARLVASKMMQELHNLEVLQLHSCSNLTELDLHGLDSLRHLELVRLKKLVTVTLTGSSGTDQNVGIYESLQSVLLYDLDSLTHGPDLRSCTSLHWLKMLNCPKLTNLEEFECPHMRDLVLEGLVPLHQLASIPIVESLESLHFLYLRVDGYVNMAPAIDAVENLDCWDQLEKPKAFLIARMLKHLRSVTEDDLSPDEEFDDWPGYVIIDWFRSGRDALNVEDSRGGRWKWF